MRHPNIVKLLALYTYDNNKHNLIFPLAKGRTLYELFNGDPEIRTFNSSSAFFKAIAGLSSAIEQVRDFTENWIDLNLIGCHYDLRPQNILVSGDSLVLADFGFSRFRDATDDSATRFEKGARDYRAPECEDINDLHFQKHLIRRSSDIWSFGCVLAELITYMIRGSLVCVSLRHLDASRKEKGNTFFSIAAPTGQTNLFMNGC